MKNLDNNSLKPTKILLMLMPFWDPLIPPLGIACLKRFIQDNGFKTKAIDVNTNDEFRTIYTRYFNHLRKYIPGNKQGHIYNIGHEVLKNHMMAYLNREAGSEYSDLVKILISNTFFSEVTDDQVYELDRIIMAFYRRLETFLLDILAAERPDIVGLSVYGGTLAASLFALKLVKENYPYIRTVIGGGIFSGELSLVSPDFEFFLEKTPYIDKIIVGEGEKLFLKLLQGKLPDSQRVFKLENLPGDVLDLSGAEIPDFSDFDLQYYPKIAGYTSRSCPFRCNFCVETTYWGKFRKKSGKQVVEELVKLYKEHNRRAFLMCDSLLNPVIDEIAREFIKSGICLYWGGYLRVDHRVCDIENTIRWRQGGFYRARLGIESGSPRVLHAMNKKIAVPQIKTSVSSLAYAGIKTTAMFVIGYPGETEADFQKTLELMAELKDDIYEADCNPFWYFYGGQINSKHWQQKGKPALLYPTSARNMLILQTRVLEGEPSHRETYERINRFIQHCNRLRLPNPYSLRDTNSADERWKKLHKNAVPSLLDINSNLVGIHESRQVGKLVFAKKMPMGEAVDDNWSF